MDQSDDHNADPSAETGPESGALSDTFSDTLSGAEDEVSADVEPPSGIDVLEAQAYEVPIFGDTHDLTAQKLEARTYSLTTLVQSSLLAGAIGLIIGLVVVPMLRVSMPDSLKGNRHQAAQAADPALVTLGPKTLLAKPSQDMDLASTNLSLQQYLDGLENRAREGGRDVTRTIKSNAQSVVIDYVFAQKTNNGQKGAVNVPVPTQLASHPDNLKLTFTAGPTNGDLVLAQVMTNGQIVPMGQVYVDLIALGASAPPLGLDQLWTRRGRLALSDLGDAGTKLTLDGEEMNLGLGFDGVVSNYHFIGRFPPAGPYADIILVSGRVVSGRNSGRASGVCNNAVGLYDVNRGRWAKMAHHISGQTISLRDINRQLEIGPFCDNAPVNPAAPSRLDGIYDRRSGALSWRRQLLPPPPPAPSAPTDNGAASPWRVTSDNRIASPIAAGGVLVSLSCSADHFPSIAVSGLPAPANGTSAQIFFDAGGGGASAEFSWIASAGAYELNGRTHGAQTRAMARRLSASGPLMVTAEGQHKQTTTPGSNLVNQILRQCAPLEPNAANAPSAH